MNSSRIILESESPDPFFEKAEDQLEGGDSEDSSSSSNSSVSSRKEKVNWSSVSHLDLPLWRKTLRILTPHCCMMRRKRVPDAFYYPQSFIAGCLISFVSVFYISLQCFKVLGDFKTNVQKSYSNVYDIMFSFFRNGNA